MGPWEGGPLSSLGRHKDKNVGTQLVGRKAFLPSSPLQNIAKNDCFSQTRGSSQGKNKSSQAEEGMIFFFFYGFLLWGYVRLGLLYFFHLVSSI